MSRKLYVGNFDPDTIPGFEIDQIRPDALPNKIINAIRLALADGERLVAQNFENRKITVLGHFYAGSRSAYETARDTLLGVFNSQTVQTIVFEQSGSDRRYTGVYENMSFEYKDNGTCIVTIIYRCTDPFGEKVAPTTFFDEVVTSETTRVIDSGGNIYGLPKITARIEDIDDDEAERTFAVSITQGTDTRRLAITRIWGINDTVTVDSKKQRVYVNGSQVEFSGQWPRVLKTNTFRFNMVDAATFEVDLLVTYNERYL